MPSSPGNCIRLKNQDMVHTKLSDSFSGLVKLSSSATFFILFTAPAGACVISPDFGLAPNYGLSLRMSAVGIKPHPVLFAKMTNLMVFLMAIFRFKCSFKFNRPHLIIRPTLVGLNNLQSCPLGRLRPFATILYIQMFYWFLGREFFQ